MFVPRSTYQRALNEVAYLRERVGHLEAQLELERHESRLAERHWANALLRAKGSFPQQEAKPEPVPVRERDWTELVDQGELEAMRAEAIRLGLDPAEADAVLRKERGLGI